ncbi:MAG: DUF4097 domain-containing protein [bacterium]|nr:DUF4097 domain-containing protein [bacterium]
MKRTNSQNILAGIGLGLLVCAAAHAQEPQTDRLAVPLTDPSKPASLKVSMVQGGITVKGYDGSEVIVEGLRRGQKAEASSKKAAGLRRIAISGTGLKVTEDDNEVKVSASALMKAVDLTIQVPRSTSLNIRTVNNGHITVEGISGEIEATNVNGRVSVTDVAGSVVANTVNGGVKVTFTEVTSDKLMSFSSLNGDIDVTFPADVRANVKMETENGDVYTDFDIQMDTTPREPIVDEREESEEREVEGGRERKRARYRVRTEHAARGTINGGGPEFSFKTFNGDIFIRQAK